MLPRARDQCYDLKKNIFAEELAFLTQNLLIVYKYQRSPTYRVARHFHTKNGNLGIFYKFLGMETVGIFHGHLVYLIAILTYFMAFLLYFMAILVYLWPICYIFLLLDWLYQEQSGNPVV
jgi:hypothetical protein